MSDSISGRTRTPSDLKWLLNERAATAGALEEVAVRRQHLTKKLARLQKTLEDLDTAIGLLYPQVQIDAAGVVHAWAGKYGKRGALTESIKQALRDAHPASINVPMLRYCMAQKFGLSVLTYAETESLRNSIKNCLSRLVKTGQVEYIRNPAGGNAPGAWRWKPPTSFADIAAKAQRLANAKAEARNASSPDSNPS